MNTNFFLNFIVFPFGLIAFILFLVWIMAYLSKESIKKEWTKKIRERTLEQVEEEFNKKNQVITQQRIRILYLENILKIKKPKPVIKLQNINNIINLNDYR
jgi:hypothetical protein